MCVLPGIILLNFLLFSDIYFKILQVSLIYGEGQFILYKPESSIYNYMVTAMVFLFLTISIIFFGVTVIIFILLRMAELFGILDVMVFS